MGHQDEAAATTTEPNQPGVCEECKLNPSKYKCPACFIRSCSLNCVKAHKQRSGCTGKRQQTDFVPLSKFNDSLLLSDYNMLEDVKRIAESAQRMRVKLCGYPHFRLPFFLKSLRSAAASRRTKLLFLPSGMAKREANQSRYNNRKKFISWTIEWRFHSTDVVLIDHGVHENTNLCSVIESHLRPGPWNHPLKQFCQKPLDSLKFFIRKFPKGPKSPFRELDIKAPIRQQLAEIVILEYPVIYVFLPSHSYNFEVIKDILPCKPEIKESVDSYHPCQKGVTFREEEVEDGSSFDPQVLDLMKLAKPDPVVQISHQDRGTGKVLNNTLDRPLLAKVAQDSKPVIESDVYIHKVCDGTFSTSKIKQHGFLEDMDFVFEQGLIDAYSNLIAETNPDDFLDLEGVLGAEVKMEERNDYPDFSGIFTAEEELEEGEIPGS